MEEKKQIIASCAYARYDYEIKSNEKSESHTRSNNIVVDIISPQIELVKTIISPIEVNQDFLTYKLVIENEGNIEITNIEVSNPHNDNLIFKKGSLTIDGKLTDFDIFKGFNISKLRPKQRLIIIYDSIIKKDTPTYKVPNLTTLKYDYKLNGALISETKVSNTVYADILVELITINKTSNKNVASCQDLVTITTIIQNLGNTSLKDIHVEEFGNNNYEVVENSIFINGILSNQKSPDIINIPLIKENSQVIITYDIRTPKPPLKDDEINIESILTYKSNNELKSITSNKVIVNIKYAYLVVTKTVDKLKARSGEQLTYLIEIKNQGNVKASNIFFNDIIAEGMKFIYGTLKVNDVIKGDLNPTIGFFLDDIDASESVLISYQVDIVI